jgi:AcrR family transcriptional regulator
MPANPRHHDRVSALLLESAAEEFSRRGQRASMSHIAERAGVSRATIYNYFATREELLDALEIAAISAAESRLAEADLDSLSVAEAVEAFSVAVVSCGAQFAVAIQPLQDRPLQAGEELIRPILLRLITRGLEDGTLSASYSVDLLMSLFYGMVLGALLSTRQGAGTPAEIGRSLAQIFLEGAGARMSADAPSR